MLNPYEVLAVATTAEPSEIKGAFRRLVRTCHPDLHGDDAELRARFEALTWAQRLLADPLRRGFYDAFGKDPADLGFDEAKIRQALHQQRRAAAPPKPRIARSACSVCGGTGIRPSGRSCSCDPDIKAKPAPAPVSDPFADLGVRQGRVRMPKRPPPKGPAHSEQRVTLTRPDTPPNAPPSDRPAMGSQPASGPSMFERASRPGGRVRLKKKD
jgi:curved DNA-binding protein CbpA